jgi:CheY-like chemotaxis protein
MTRKTSNVDKEVDRRRSTFSLVAGMGLGEDSPESGAGSHTRASTDERQILIVDDVTMTACLTQAMLAHQGLNATIANCAQSALEWLNEHRADVVLCDISMPGMSGIELAREIRSRWSDARPRLIAYTAYPREHQRIALLDEGFDDFVAKPVRAEQLAEVVRKWMN